MISNDDNKHIAIIVLAAGLSKRLGRPKQLLMGRHRLLLAEVLETVLSLEYPHNVLVLGNQAEAVISALSSEAGLSETQLSRIKMVLNPYFARGQASSVQAGIRVLPEDCQGALFVMGDQAALDRDLLTAIIDTFTGYGGRKVVRPFYGGRPGGPVMWPRSFFQDLQTLTGDTGGRRLFEQIPKEAVHELHFSAEQRPWDIDTEDIYEAWLKQLDDRK